MPRRGLDRAQVVDAASRTADAEGLDALTIARVAKELGVRGPSLYNHVASREELLAAVGTRGARELTDAMRDATVGRAGEDALRAMAAAYRDYARTAPGRYAATQRVAEDPEQRAAAQEGIDVVLAILAGFDLEGEAAIHATRSVRSALHGFVLLETGCGFGLPQDLDASFDKLVGTLVAGLTCA